VAGLVLAALGEAWCFLATPFLSGHHRDYAVVP